MQCFPGLEFPWYLAQTIYDQEVHQSESTSWAGVVGPNVAAAPAFVDSETGPLQERAAIRRQQGVLH
jgi:hypothetical protein